jgi:glycosyltransferase involved in cell wall biosynthesis
MRLLFVRGGATGFTERDLTFFRKKASMTITDTLSDLKNSSMLKKTTAVYTSDVIYVWFVGRHSALYILLGTLFLKKIIIVAGGYDVANVPEIEYGSMTNVYKKLITRACLKMASRVVAVSKSNYIEIIKNGKVSSEKITLIEHCLRVSVASAAVVFKDKENMVLTVGEIRNENLMRKGLLEYAKFSNFHPELKFILAGRLIDPSAFEELSKIGPSMEFVIDPSDDDLNSLFRRSKFYIQLSRHEAFGLSVLEAMHHGCNVIISNKYALPEVVEDKAANFSSYEQELAFDISKAVKYHRRANDYYSIEKWERKMTSLMESVTQ